MILIEGDTPYAEGYAAALCGVPRDSGYRVYWGNPLQEDFRAAWLRGFDAAIEINRGTTLADASKLGDLGCLTIRYHGP